MENVDVIKPLGMPLNRVHGEYALLSPAQVRLRAQDKLQEYIENGRKRAAAAVQRILAEQAQDRVARFESLHVETLDRAHGAGSGEGFALLTTGGQDLGQLHDHALRQVSERLGIPTKYVNQLRGSDWGRDLIAKNINEHTHHADRGDKVLVRSVGDQVRGVLSASYRTDDSRPALDALIGVARDVNAVICDGDALDVRTSIKMVIAEPVELFPGEFAVFGLDYRNSDYGAGARELSGFILRLLCLNGAVTTSSFRRVHLGARIQDEVEYSTRTRRLNADFTASAARDMARAMLGPESVAKMVDQVRTANAAALDPDAAIASIKKSVNKDEQKLIVDKYNSPDVELLPPGNTKWRFSNAISWLAGGVEDAGRKLELQSLAGEVLA
jgi:hypothetical protein